MTGRWVVEVSSLLGSFYSSSVLDPKITKLSINTSQDYRLCIEFETSHSNMTNKSGKYRKDSPAWPVARLKSHFLMHVQKLTLDGGALRGGGQK